MANRLERRQKNIGIISTSMIFGLLMFFGFVWVMFEIMGMQSY